MNYLHIRYSRIMRHTENMSDMMPFKLDGTKIFQIHVLVSNPTSTVFAPGQFSEGNPYRHPIMCKCIHPVFSPLHQNISALGWLVASRLNPRTLRVGFERNLIDFYLEPHNIRRSWSRSTVNTFSTKLRFPNAHNQRPMPL
jgi:hypothetical protein